MAEREKKNIEFRWENLKERDHKDDLSMDYNKTGLQKCHGESWN
jgi:hypothetical protein